jgi:hypothetical protein
MKLPIEGGRHVIGASSNVATASSNRERGEQAAWASKEWYRDFKSLELDGLIAQAASDNLDLAAERARLTQADANTIRSAGITKSFFFAFLNTC